MGKLLWKPSEDLISKANMTRFINFVNDRWNLQVGSYSELLEWSIKNIPDFWETFWDFAEIVASKKYDLVVEDLDVFPGTKWFPGAKLNFAENLLRFKDENLAFVFRGETRISKKTTNCFLIRNKGRFL